VEDNVLSSFVLPLLSTETETKAAGEEMEMSDETDAERVNSLLLETEEQREGGGMEREGVKVTLLL
jgi:hypothetical protein